MKGKKSENSETLARVILLLLMLVTVCFIIRGGRKMALSVSSDKMETAKDRPCVVIDAGHGGSR